MTGRCKITPFQKCYVLEPISAKVELTQTFKQPADTTIYRLPDPADIPTDVVQQAVSHDRSDT